MGSKKAATLRMAAEAMAVEMETMQAIHVRRMSDLQTSLDAMTTERDNLRGQVTEAEKTVVHLTETVIPNMRDTAARAVGVKEAKIQEMERELAAGAGVMLKAMAEIQELRAERLEGEMETATCPWCKRSP